MLEQTHTKIFVNGVFDLIHKFHIELLNYAKSLGDVLYVGIDSDERVRQLKGPTRPIINQDDRSFFLRIRIAFSTLLFLTSIFKPTILPPYRFLDLIDF